MSEILEIEKNNLEDIPNDWQNEKDCLPSLQNSLDILPKCPGIFPIESICQLDKRLKPFFSRMPAYSQINEAVIAPYFPPSTDKNLARLAEKAGAKYLTSTSTITSVLSHVYYSLSNYKSPHFNELTQAYDKEPMKFMVSQRKPNTVFLRRIATVGGRKLYGINSDGGF